MITFAILTCNRLNYLKNCVNSVLEFVDLDGINLLIIDSNTVEKGFDDYISSLPGFVDVKVFPGRSPNELHRSMNYAIDYAKKKGDDYVNFLQDDYQFLYKYENMNTVVNDAFDNRKNVVQLQFNMGWKRKSKRIGKVTVDNINGTTWFLLHQKPACDNGFTRVALYDKIGMYPKFVSIHGKENGEAWLAKKSKGYKRMMITQPNMGMMIDCAYVRGDERLGKYFPPPNKYYLKPFTEDKIELIKIQADNGKMSFIEDWVEPHGWEPTAFGKHSKDPTIERL